MVIYRSISREELGEHATRQDCWIALHGWVLRVDAKTLQEHPGGAQSILRFAGTDCTTPFEDAGHSDFARDWCNRLEVMGQFFDVDENEKQSGAASCSTRRSFLKSNDDIISNMEQEEQPRKKIPGVVGRHHDLEMSSQRSPTVPEDHLQDHPLQEVEGAARHQVPVRIARMFVYPIKACAGVEIDRAVMTKHGGGFAHDREYVFAAEQDEDEEQFHNTEEHQLLLPDEDEKTESNTNGCTKNAKRRFLKLLVPYDLPALAWIQPSLPTSKGMQIELRNYNSSAGQEHPLAEVDDSFFVPRISSAKDGTSKRYVNMYKKCLLEGIDQGDAVADRVTKFLHHHHPEVVENLALRHGKNDQEGKNSNQQHNTNTSKIIRLLLLTDRSLLHPETVHTGLYHQPRGGSNYTPFMFMREQTLAAINRKFFPTEPLRVTILRFRPNIVFREEDVEAEVLARLSRGSRPNGVEQFSCPTSSDFSFSEDSWETVELRHQPSRFLRVLKSCGRCSHIFVNPALAVCDGDFVQKELCRLGRDARGMLDKLESKLHLLKNKSKIFATTAIGRRGDVEQENPVLARINSTSVLVDPVLPWFRSHYQKFLDAGRTTKVFLGLCGSFHSEGDYADAPSRRSSSTSDCVNIFHVGQEWVANLSTTRSLNEFRSEMLRPCQDNRALLEKTRPIDLLCAYGPDFLQVVPTRQQNKNLNIGEDDEAAPAPDPGEEEVDEPAASRTTTISSLLEDEDVFLPQTPAFERNTRRHVTVTEVVELSRTAKRIRFSFGDHVAGPRSPSPTTCAPIPPPAALGLPCGYHVATFGENPAFARSTWNKQPQSAAEKLTPFIKRSFTPVRCGKGFFDLVVKIYRMKNSKGADEQQDDEEGNINAFPDGGRLTGHFLDRLVVNDKVQIAGPFGHIRYLGDGRFRLLSGLCGSKPEDHRPNIRKFSQVGMVAGGSGITPMLQVLQFAAAEAGPPPFQAHLVYANKTEEDILCREWIESDHCRKVLLGRNTSRGSSRTKYVISAKGERICEEIFKNHLPPPHAETLVLLCGPPGMVAAARNFLRNLGHEAEQIHEF
ncbi:unnamed protein product [Amoebophrya sp. A120]|nr:unnamed protein product [Amoebophrya sp. A120]|eukprot:GSA120T00025298001.1